MQDLKQLKCSTARPNLHLLLKKSTDKAHKDDAKRLKQTSDITSKYFEGLGFFKAFFSETVKIHPSITKSHL